MINRILYWWHKRKPAKKLKRRETALAYMIFLDNPGHERTNAWITMFEDDYHSELRVLKRKYKI